MDYYVKRERKKSNTAGKKAPDDVCAICKELGMQPLVFPYDSGIKSIKLNRIVQFVRNTLLWRKYGRKLQPGDSILYQHPMYASAQVSIFTLKAIQRIKEKKGISVTLIIHDLESIRGGLGGMINEDKEKNAELDALIGSVADHIICHNSSMRDYMTGHGFNAEKLVCLEIFDYLSDDEMPERNPERELSIDIAGNLSPEKSGYAYKVAKENPDIRFNLYGVRYEEGIIGENAVYRGSFTPEELMKELNGRFGLVWDGAEIYSCVGNTGNYLRYNNPHKCSLFLASGIPVIIWKQAALAPFIEQNNVGITVESLLDLKSTLASISEEDYLRMVQNVEKLGEKLRSGHFLKNALETLE